MSECQEKYSVYSRGSNCYETNHWGAYHQHFQVHPRIKEHGGLLLGKDHGLHDSDYFLEVKTVNNALLTTTIRKKVMKSIVLFYAVLISRMKNNIKIKHQKKGFIKS